MTPAGGMAIEWCDQHERCVVMRWRASDRRAKSELHLISREARWASEQLAKHADEADARAEVRK